MTHEKITQILYRNYKIQISKALKQKIERVNLKLYLYIRIDR